jgi:hypothetical protein
MAGLHLDAAIGQAANAQLFSTMTPILRGVLAPIDRAVEELRGTILPALRHEMVRPSFVAHDVEQEYEICDMLLRLQGAAASYFAERGGKPDDLPSAVGVALTHALQQSLERAALADTELGRRV